MAVSRALLAKGKTYAADDADTRGGLQHDVDPAEHDVPGGNELGGVARGSDRERQAICRVVNRCGDALDREARGRGALCEVDIDAGAEGRVGGATRCCQRIAEARRLREGGAECEEKGEEKLHADFA